jgi:uncharacterized protein (DUF302 family)
MIMKNIAIGVLTVVVVVLGVLMFTGGGEEPGNNTAQMASEDNMAEIGLVGTEREIDFGSTTAAIRNAIESNENLTLMAEVDHSANADTVELPLEPTALFIFGNPNVGTPLLQESDTAGIDFPQKMLVTERDGQVVVYHNDPDYLSDRHTIRGEDFRLGKVADLLNSIANAGGE